MGVNEQRGGMTRWGAQPAITRHLRHHTIPEAPRYWQFRGTKYLCTVPTGRGGSEPSSSPSHSPATASSSLPPPAVALQFLQLLLHQVGLGCGLGELQCTANNDKSELPLHATAAGLMLDCSLAACRVPQARLPGCESP